MPLSTPAGCVGGGLASPRIGPENLEPGEPGRPRLSLAELWKQTKERAGGERKETPQEVNGSFNLGLSSVYLSGIVASILHLMFLSSDVWFRARLDPNVAAA